ncbi:unnamed protein product [Angiostrongylus costaricensis]|uniref:Transcriptional regulator n=1 Tax=Angiostrongylus costaricensis TaxID=334426 RepID=A0A0R3PL05_ANGCS|nr:unnamed protein product [Angiostrongylus costaricensis]
MFSGRCLKNQRRLLICATSYGYSYQVSKVNNLVDR